MAEPAISTGARHILLATDLSARCDRALERTLALASVWKAKLTILHVMQPIDSIEVDRNPVSPSSRRPPDVVETARQRIRMGLRADVADTVQKADVRVEEGDAAEWIERVAEAQGCDLIVTGIAREEPFASTPVIVGRTVDRLLRRSAVPILIVRNRTHSAYEHIVVGTDFSDASGHALQAALRLFPFQRLRLFHAYTAPYSNLLSKAPARDGEDRALVEVELEEFLGRIFLPEDERRRIDPLIEQGVPEHLLREFVRDQSADLVVLGTRGRGAVMETLIGSTAKKILSTLPCDALVLRAPREVRAEPG